ASYGANGFTADHRAALLRAKTRRVYCAYDADPAGDSAAEALARDLAEHDIEVLRVVLPAKDPNDFLKAGGTREDFQALLDQARPVIAPTDEPVAVSSPATPATATDGVFTLAIDGRTYELLALPRPDSMALRVRLKVRCEGRTFLNGLNLYSDTARAAAIRRLAVVFGSGVPREQIETDLFSLIEELERRARLEPADAGPAADTMTPTERETALAFLKSPNLVALIRQDLQDLGVVGEDDNKILVYLVATSRKLPKPLSLVVVSRSSAGKSFLVLRVCELIPEEERLEYTRMSAKALFHDEPERLKHKLITIEEAQGMEEAAYALRVMQSNQKLRTLSTITDPTTGRHRACENVVYGPVALVVTTTQELDFETVSRAFVISVDESAQQTRRIQEMQRRAETLEGLAHQMDTEAIVARHRNAQRLLQPTAVVNPYAPNLTFPSTTLRLRREHAKYLVLIQTITFLFQYQRTPGVYEKHGRTCPYIETDPADVDLANELVVTSLRQAFEEVTEPSRNLLRLIRKMVEAKAGGGPLTEVRFTRREIREFTEWQDHPMREHLEKLEKLEYVVAQSGSFGKQYVYTLTPDHWLAAEAPMSRAEEIRALGLTSSADLAKMPNGGRALPHPPRARPTRAQGPRSPAGGPARQTPPRTTPAKGGQA
ncbi:MAG: toprim domain-containing protein, partial [Gemmatimonadales bacterium]